MLPVLHRLEIEAAPKEDARFGARARLQQCPQTVSFREDFCSGSLLQGPNTVAAVAAAWMIEAPVQKFAVNLPVSVRSPKAKQVKMTWTRRFFLQPNKCWPLDSPVPQSSDSLLCSDQSGV